MTEATSDIYQGETLYIYRCEDCGDSVTLDHPSNDPLCAKCEGELAAWAREALVDAEWAQNVPLAEVRAELGV